MPLSEIERYGAHFFTVQLQSNVHPSFQADSVKEIKEKEAEVEQSQTLIDELSGRPGTSQKGRPITTPIDEFWARKGAPVKYQLDSDIQKRADLDRMIFLATCNLPFSFVETEGYIRHVESLNAKVNHRSRHYMSRKMCPLVYKNLVVALEELLAKELPETDGCAFTADEWTSRALHGYLSVTIHYLTKDWKMRKFTVTCRSTEDRKGSEGGIASLFTSIIETIPGIKCY